MSGKHRAPESASTVGKAFGRLRPRTRVVVGATGLGLVAVVASGGVVMATMRDEPDKVAVAEPPARATPPHADRAVRPSPTPSKASPSPTPSKSPTPSPSPSKARKKKASSDDEPVTDGKRCEASFYDEGQQTANGEQFDPSAYTAAHKTLSFGTRVKVTNPNNGKTVTVRINDRGPYISGRCLDLSRAAFADIASTGAGAIEVEYKVLG